MLQVKCNVNLTYTYLLFFRSRRRAETEFANARKDSRETRPTTICALPVSSHVVIFIQSLIQSDKRSFVLKTQQNFLKLNSFYRVDGSNSVQIFRTFLLCFVSQWDNKWFRGNFVQEKLILKQGWPDFFARGPNFENIFQRGPQIFNF